MMSSGRYRVAVTGGAGFIGRHLVDWLTEAGCDAIGIDDYRSSRFAPGDAPLCQWSKARDADYSSTDILIHAAAYVSESLSVERPMRCWAANVDETAATVERACRSGVQRVVYLSSTAVYGECRDSENGRINLASEWQRCKPIDPYGASKLAGELATQAICEAHGVPWVAIRLHNLFGPGQVPGFGLGRSVVAIWCEQLYQGQPLSIVGTGEQVRSWCYVDDLRPEILDLCSAEDVFEKVAGSPWNVGEGVATTVTTLADLLLEAAEFPADHPRQYLPLRPEARVVLPCTEGWGEALGRPDGLKPQSLLLALRSTWQWYRRWRASVDALPTWDAGFSEVS